MGSVLDGIAHVKLMHITAPKPIELFAAFEKRNQNMTMHDIDAHSTDYPVSSFSGPEDDLLSGAIEEIESLQRINMRMAKDLAYISELIGGDGIEHVPTQLASRIGGFAEVWSSEPPTEQGLYWHWSGQKGDSPIPLNVLWSGTVNRCFVSRGQYGIDSAVFCEKYGGLWRQAILPDTDMS